MDPGQQKTKPGSLPEGQIQPRAVPIMSRAGGNSSTPSRLSQAAGTPGTTDHAGQDTKLPAHGKASEGSSRS